MRRACRGSVIARQRLRHGRGRGAGVKRCRTWLGRLADGQRVARRRWFGPRKSGNREPRDGPLGQINDQMPVPGRDAAMKPALNRLPVQTERIGHHGATAERPKDCGMVVLAHPAQFGCKVLPTQELNCAARSGANRPHNGGVSKKARPLSTHIIAEQVGERIQWVRELIEPNRAAFARIIGVDRAVLRGMESGRRPPSIYAVIALAHRLRVSTDYILTGSLRGVDGELAAKLIALHPELLASSNQINGHSSDTPHRGGGPNTPNQPTTPVPAPLQA
jgi:transcriptional regulator with XRE-family HTH domain